MGWKEMLAGSAVAAVLLFAATGATGRKKGYKLEVPKTAAGVSETERMARGSFMVASQCEDCNNGYRLEQIAFSGYDKTQRSAVESFFITNNTDRTMTGITMYIDYRMPDGRQLHKRFVRLVCDIPPGETRKADIESWDRQRTFYYELSEPPRKGGTPYRVVFDPISYYLRF